jgi:hypothetical protein
MSEHPDRAGYWLSETEIRRLKDAEHEHGWHVGHREALRGWKSIEECWADAKSEAIRDAVQRVEALPRAQSKVDGLVLVSHSSVIAAIKGDSDE